MALNVVVGGTSVSDGAIWRPVDPAATDARVGMANGMFERGDVTGARGVYLEVMQVRPFDWWLYWVVGLCDMRMGRLNEAGGPLRRAVELEPRAARAQAWLGEWFLRKGMIAQALHATEVALELEPGDVGYMESRAWVLEAAGELDTSWEMARKLMAKGHGTASFARLYGRLAPRFGEEKRALEMVMGLLAKGVSGEDVNLYFAAAALLDKAGKFAEAFACARQGNELRPHHDYDAAEVTRGVDRAIAFFTRERMERFGRKGHAGHGGDRPVFIVGMPRSGTSLVEQIVASHPLVHGAGELDGGYEMVMGSIRMMSGGIESYPEQLEGISDGKLAELGSSYLWKLVSNAPAGAVRVTDKMPLNLMHLGLIQMALPGARVVHCRRNALDTCVSCYMTDFTAGNEFKYRLADLGHFYREQERLMGHWKRVLRMPVMEVGYEEVVGDAEGMSRKMIAFMGLEWNERCGRFWETKRTVATASVQQVRRPIYASSVGRWKHYEEWLGELKLALGDLV